MSILFNIIRNQIIYNNKFSEYIIGVLSVTQFEYGNFMHKKREYTEEKYFREIFANI